MANIKDSKNTIISHGVESLINKLKMTAYKLTNEAASIIKDAKTSGSNDESGSRIQIIFLLMPAKIHQKSRVWMLCSWLRAICGWKSGSV